MTGRRPFIFAIDGGGSKTLARLYDAAGNPLAETRGGPANFYQNQNASIQQIQALWQDLSALASPEQTILAAGLAGIEAAGSDRLISHHFGEFAKHIAIGDAEAAFIAGFDDAPGLMMIVGTGVAAMRRRSTGAKAELCSGWGFPIHDQGGGAWMGAELVRHYLDHQDSAKTLASALFRAVALELGQDRRNIIQWLGKAKPSDFARFVPAIIASTESLAEEILDHAAGKLISLAKNVLQGDNLTIRLAGGLAPFMHQRLQLGLKSTSMPEFREIDPLDGLVRLAQKSMEKSGDV